MYNKSLDLVELINDFHDYNKFNHPDFELTALAASSRSAGKRYEDATTWYMNEEMPESVRDIKVVETSPDAMDNDVDIVFSSLPGNPDILPYDSILFLLFFHPILP